MPKSYEITNKIRTLRFFANEMSQQTLAELTGVSRQTINAIELGKYTPSLDLAYKIAHVFNVLIDDVFEYAPMNEPNKESK
ncbi:MAG TPA: transcriptional regulator [Acholeplasmataceae bacterium]|nr:transcriptional regulator [Acholeplasmataceae bacterium]HBY65766.1 transcriptional regulator [Acholeplasmataceae bacterium]HCB67240.1 transcriptional regulator [Acholeplasmataceae bacterium]